MEILEVLKGMFYGLPEGWRAPMMYLLHVIIVLLSGAILITVIGVLYNPGRNRE
jgi:hypothetical protein